MICERIVYEKVIRGTDENMKEARKMFSKYANVSIIPVKGPGNLVMFRATILDLGLLKRGVKLWVEKTWYFLK